MIFAITWIFAERRAEIAASLVEEEERTTTPAPPIQSKTSKKKKRKPKVDPPDIAKTTYPTVIVIS